MLIFLRRVDTFALQYVTSCFTTCMAPAATVDRDYTLGYCLISPRQTPNRLAYHVGLTSLDQLSGIGRILIETCFVITVSFQ